MIDYLDTSLVVSAATWEKRTAEMQTWLASRPAGSLAISEWVITEFSAALSIKLRTGHLNRRQRADALAKFMNWTSEVFAILPIQVSYFRDAARFADNSSPGLRAGGALHLAIAFDSGARLCTLDSDLYEAANTLGVKALFL